MKFHFLGTGSSYPTPTRGTSSMVLQLEDGSSWIFDCGEGTQIQLQKVPISRKKINKIFITHLHGDHLFGLPGLLCTISSQIGSTDDEKPVIDIFGPLGLRQFLYVTLSLSRSPLMLHLQVHELQPYPTQFPDDWKEWNVDHQPPAALHPSELPARIIDPTTDENGSTFWNIFEGEHHTVVAGIIHHRIPSFGYIIKEKDKPGTLLVEKLKSFGLKSGPSYGRLKAGLSVTLDDGRVIEPSQVLGPTIRGRVIVICGDTRDASPLLPLVRECDVLVHEATHDDSLAEKAFEFGHSTPSQAAEFGLKIGAKILLLNHFSQRYSDEPREGETGDESVNLLLTQAKKRLAGTQVEVHCTRDLFCFTLERPKRVEGS